jgi:hypothetical protein
MVKSAPFLALVLTTTLTGSAFASTVRPATSPTPGRTAVVVDHFARSSGSPAKLRLDRDDLVMGLRVFLGIWTVDLPLVGSDFHLDAIEQGPDGVDPLGVKGGGIRSAPPTQ